MKNLLYIPCVALVLLCAPVIFGQSTEEAELTIQGEGLAPMALGLERIRNMPSISLELMDRDQGPQTFKGVPLEKLLNLAGVSLGPQLRGEDMAKYVRVTAADGYQVVFSLAELDPMLSGNRVLLAYEKDGKTLEPGYGPLRLVVPQDKKRARWLREIRTISILIAN